MFFCPQLYTHIAQSRTFYPPANSIGRLDNEHIVSKVLKGFSGIQTSAAGSHYNHVICSARLRRQRSGQPKQNSQ
jgi:hypothetical protein